MRHLYAAFAVILPVSLGLGLVHLSSVGRIDAYTAVAAALALAGAMGAAIYTRDAAWDEEPDERGKERD